MCGFIRAASSAAYCAIKKNPDELPGFPESSCQPSWAALYEDLRRQALEGNSSQRGLGMALLLRQGMVAWMKAWLQSTPRPQEGSKPPASAGAVVADDRLGEVVVILAAMALSHWQEQRI
jgi:hypothetical protein